MVDDGMGDEAGLGISPPEGGSTYEIVRAAVISRPAGIGTLEIASQPPVSVPEQASSIPKQVAPTPTATPVIMAVQPADKSGEV